MVDVDLLWGVQNTQGRQGMRDERLHYRFLTRSLGITVALRERAAAAPLPGHLLDLSAGGCALAAPTGLDLKAGSSCTLVLPLTHRDRMTVTPYPAVVVSVEPHGRTAVVLRLRFRPRAFKEQQLLLSWLRSLRAQIWRAAAQRDAVPAAPLTARPRVAIGPAVVAHLAEGATTTGQGATESGGPDVLALQRPIARPVAATPSLVAAALSEPAAALPVRADADRDRLEDGGSRMVALPGHHEGSAPDCAFEARLIPLMPPEQEAALAAVLGLLSPEEQRALLAQIAETLEHAGHDDDAALLRVAMRTQVVAPAACFCGAFTNLNPPASFCPSP